MMDGFIAIHDDFLPASMCREIHELADDLPFSVARRGPEARVPEALRAAVQERVDALSPAVDWSHSEYACFYRATPHRYMRREFPFHAHQDGGVNIVLFLNPSSELGGATAFYEHIDLGLDGLHDYDAVSMALERTGLTWQELIVRLHRDLEDASQWREVRRVDAKFNRLVYFDGLRFHSHAPHGSEWLDSTQTRRTLNWFGDLSRPSDSRGLVIRELSRYYQQRFAES